MPIRFEDWEVPQGFWAELGPPMAHTGSHLLHNSRYAWRDAIWNSWVVEVWLYKVREAYDILCLL